MRKIGGYFILAIVLVGYLWILRSASAAQKQQQVSGVPTFEVDPSWPNMEGNWIFGSIAGITIDPTNDHV
jgi:hypothetical protein